MHCNVLPRSTCLKVRSHQHSKGWQLSAKIKKSHPKSTALVLWKNAWTLVQLELMRLQQPGVINSYQVDTFGKTPQWSSLSTQRVSHWVVLFYFVCFCWFLCIDSFNKSSKARTSSQCVYNFTHFQCNAQLVWTVWNAVAKVDSDP